MMEREIIDEARRQTRVALGKVIKTARKGKKLSRRELAELTGISVNNVERIEGGVYNYTINNLIAISDALGLSLHIE